MLPWSLCNHSAESLKQATNLQGSQGGRVGQLGTPPLRLGSGAQGEDHVGREERNFGKIEEKRKDLETDGR